MKAIKSLEELKKIRETANERLNIRRVGEEEHTKIMVGMATCGIAAGARETFNTLYETIHAKNLQHVYLVQVGCMGYCHDEPIVQVNVPGEPPILYGKVDKKKATEIIEKHIENGELLQDSIISKSFHKV